LFTAGGGILAVEHKGFKKNPQAASRGAQDKIPHFPG